MRRATPLSFLTPGRCFTLAEPASLLDDDAEGAGGFRYGKSILQPGMVFKVVPDDADGDDVAVESAAGESTRFPKTASVVEVPREGFERLAARGSGGRGVTKPRLSVLVVDDDPDIRTIAELALARVGGFDVTLAASGPEALAALDAGGPLPSCVLLDMTMPGMSGAEVAREISAHPRLTELPVIFLTGRVGEGDVATYKELGAAGLIEKPFDPLDLPRRVRACIDTDGSGPGREA